jgi:hypothetical protein
MTSLPVAERRGPDAARYLVIRKRRVRRDMPALVAGKSGNQRVRSRSQFRTTTIGAGGGSLTGTARRNRRPSMVS